jgi:molybdate transport system ATP-binding protein
MSKLKFECRHRYDSGFEMDISLDVDVRFTALFGPSGSGKTSILSMIAGLIQPQYGWISVAGETLLDTRSKLCLPPEARNVGVVFQDSLLFPHLTVASNLRYGARWRKRKRRSVPFDRVVEVLEIGHLLSRYPHSLSGGERQRVALARALLSGPELLLMDEPLASLDAPLKARVLAYLERVVSEWNVPTLFVTHAQAEVRRAADWVVLIERGRLLGCGPVDEVLVRPEPLGWTNSTGPINLLRIERVEQRDGLAIAHIGRHRLQLPPKQLPQHRPLFVQFSPADVVLSRRDVKDLSARNHLSGHVSRLIHVDEAVFVAVDVGQILWAVLTPQAVDELEVASGCQVTCLIKVHSLKIVE